MTRIELEIPEMVADLAQQIADERGERLETILTSWLTYTADSLPVEQLPDDKLLQLADSQLPDDLQAELSELLAQQREDLLNSRARARLDEIMGAYRQSLVRKSQALKVAVERNLRPPLS